MKNFSRYIVVINIYVLCCFSWRTEAVKFYLIVVPEQSLEQLKKRKPCTKFIDLLVYYLSVILLAGRIVAVLYLDGNKQIGLDPGNSLIKADVSKRFPQYLKFEGGPTFLFNSYL